MIDKFLNPKNDIAFKRIFGIDRNKDILISFLNNALELNEENKIIDVEFLVNKHPETLDRKQSFLDILCQDIDKNKYIVEMQVAKIANFIKRSQFYVAEEYVTQLKAGGNYRDLKKVILIAIADHIIFNDLDDYRSKHIILEDKTYNHYLKDLAFIYLELPKFKKVFDECHNMLDKWMYFFNNADNITEGEYIKVAQNCPIIGKAYKELERVNWSERELDMYKKANRDELDYREVMKTFLEEGIEKGRQEGELSSLLRMINRKFGQIPQDYANYLKIAPKEKIETIFDRLLEAKDIDELFLD